MSTNKRTEIISLNDPPFKISDLKKVIPKHCFERSLSKSFSFMFRDIVLIVIFYNLSSYLNKVPFGWTLWPVFWFLQGLAFTGLWVVAHECGHEAFSEHRWVNDSVGFVLHTFLLVPYFSWKYSHAAHHRSTNHLQRDTVFVPKKRSNLDIKFEEMVDEVPLFRLFQLVQMFWFGWPAYLFYNAGSHTYEEWSSHFKPSSPFFNKNQKWYVHLSTAGLIGMVFVLGFLWRSFGFVWLLNYYLMPYLWTNFWLVFYTFLQHTDDSIPHYDAKQWTFLRGALATVDRDYGVFDWFHHRIGSTHVCHHIFSKIPHYHAYEATQHLIPVLGKYYNRSPDNIFYSMWVQFGRCRFIDLSDSVCWYKHLHSE